MLKRALEPQTKRLRAAIDLHNILMISIHLHVSSPVSAFLYTEPASAACRLQVALFAPAGTLFNPSDSPWLQQCIAHPSCCVLFIRRCCLPVCCATLKQKKTSTPSTRTRWRCSPRRCPLHPTLSCFMPRGK